MKIREQIKNQVDAYVEKQIKSYEKSNNYDRCYHRIQGYVSCLMDMDMITKEEHFDVLDYMLDKLDNTALTLTK